MTSIIQYYPHQNLCLECGNNYKSQWYLSAYCSQKCKATYRAKRKGARGLSKSKKAKTCTGGVL